MKSWRLWLITASIFFTYSALILNIYNLQIKKGSIYAAKAASQSRGVSYLNSTRGTIFFQDKNGNEIPAAFNRQFPMIYAVPKEIEDPAEAAGNLAPILNLPPEQIQTKFSKPKDEYELLISKASAEQVNKVRDLHLKGVYIDNEYLRFYPFAGMASHLLGFLAPTGDGGALVGKYGVESYFDDPLVNNDLHLTIDRDIQLQAEKILKNLMDKYGAEGGTVIVQEPKTGKILAMGSFPAFDPNDYAKSPMRNFLNPAIQSLYEPGSVFKVLTMAAGIDSGKITPDTTFYDSGSLVLNGKTIKNWDGKAHGKISMTGVIEQSVNTGAAFAERTTGHDIFYNYLLKFGLNDPTGISLPGELAGNLNNLKTSTRDINFATAAFGQGVSVTPLELISAISAIANGGTLMRPFIISGTAPEESSQVISKDTADKVAGMMVSAVDKAEIAKIDGYRIAGKTGTAQMADLKRGGYGTDYIHSYVGFAPVSDPKFTILMKIDKPKGVGLAGSTVVPAFRELAQFIINYYNISADRIDNSKP
ncbi:MAG: penicillin-binding protein 2 [bacterium]|nr:penicillin-binding protein 2 [bacterium]